MPASGIAQDMFPLSTKSSPIDNVFSTADASFQQEFLATHNAYRAKHNTPPMTLNSELTAAAQKWADHLLAIGALQHSETQDGENVYSMSGFPTVKVAGG